MVKNKLAAVSSEGTSIGPALKGLKGVNSVAFTSGDPVALAKVFAKWAGENAEFQFKLGIVDGKLLNVEEVKALATLPGKEELFSKLLYPDERSGAAPGYGDERDGPRSGGCDQPGRGERKVCRRRIATQAIRLSAVSHLWRS